MVAPLFLISLFLDKVNFEQKFTQIFHRPIRYRLGGKEISIAVSEAIAGITFLAMGVLILYLAFTNRLFMQAGGYQTNINIYLTKVLQSISGIAKIIPEYVWALLLILIIGGIIRRVIYQFNKEKQK